MKKCAADSERLQSLNNQIKIKMRYQLLLSHVQLCSFLLFVSENSGIFLGDAQLQLTLVDHVFKVKFALHSE